MRAKKTILGRRPKLTRQVQARIVSALRAGNFTKVAVGYAGIGRTTFYRWIHRGRAAREGIYRKFYEAVRKAEATAEVRAVAVLRKHMAEDWRAALAWLERRHPSRWGPPSRRLKFDPRKKLCELLHLSEDEMLEIGHG